jgi:hypothetical protein
MEIWKDVRGYKGRYKVSNLGRVWSVLREQKWRDGRCRIVGGQILQHNINHRGYHYVTLYRDGERRQCRVNRLVAKAFVPNPDRKPEVNHENLDKSDNRAENLRWMTRQENMNHYAMHDSWSYADIPD